MKRNAILFSRVDREDYWVSGGLCFPVKNTETYEEAYNEIRHKLETSEIVDYVIEDSCLMRDLFKNDETFKFVRTYWGRGLYYLFRNDQDEEVEHRFSANFVLIAE